MIFVEKEKKILGIPMNAIVFRILFEIDLENFQVDSRDL